MNTRQDLRREVADRLRKTLHRREIDTEERGMPKIPHMLGIVRLGAIPTWRSDTDSFLDPDHPFWQQYHEEVRTRGGVRHRVESVIEELDEQGHLRIDIDGKDIYVEVDDL